MSNNDAATNVAEPENIRNDYSFFKEVISIEDNLAQFLSEFSKITPHAYCKNISTVAEE